MVHPRHHVLGPQPDELEDMDPLDVLQKRLVLLVDPMGRGKRRRQKEQPQQGEGEQARQETTGVPRHNGSVGPGLLLDCGRDIRRLMGPNPTSHIA